MKFITEEYLRDLYKKEPFTTYELTQGERLTPGARQYLSDRGIKMSDDVSFINKSIPVVEQLKKVPVGNSNWKMKKLYHKLRSIEALFLVTSSEILSVDVFLAQSTINLGKKISNIRSAMEGKSTIENLCCRECTGINSDNFCCDLDDCFEITEFHMQLEKSREILKLHVLRCSLREIEAVVLEAYEDNDDENKIEDKIIENVNAVINSLSQMICSTIGGEKCQRKK